ncbi:DNA-invertase hin [uncultured Clostridium sp.]|nr:DNA-invertase hin [uncultured Clostridium sp.]SCJ44730.1 DNA-invertase hin [uncultured Clostridium sp.]
MIIGYVRVSTVEQNEARQLVTMEKYNVEKTFQEKVSAKDLNRPKLEEMLDYVREGDVVVVHDFSRLARSTKDLLNIVEFLNNKKVNLISSKENIDSSTPTGKLMLTMIGAINEFERSNLLERQREGIVIAKKQGKYKGRKKVHIDNFEEYYNRYMRRDASKSQIAKELNISRPTLDRILDEYKKVND